MKQLTCVLTLSLLAALSSTVLADGMPSPTTKAPSSVGDCPHPAKPITARRKKKVAPPATAPVAAPPACTCVYDQGPPGQTGPEGPAGPPGPAGQPGITNYIYTPVALRLGVMGTVYAPHGDWAWGPALQITVPGRRLDLAAEIGLAALLDGVSWSPGRQPGVMVHLGVAGHGRLSWTAGLRYDDISGTESNGHVSGQYVAADVGAVFRHRLTSSINLRIQAGPTIGGLRDTYDRGTQFIVGLAGGAFIGGSL